MMSEWPGGCKTQTEWDSLRAFIVSQGPDYKPHCDASSNEVVLAMKRAKPEEPLLTSRENNVTDVKTIQISDEEAMKSIENCIGWSEKSNPGSIRYSPNVKFFSIVGGCIIIREEKVELSEINIIVLAGHKFYRPEVD